ncbi:tetratricopeptide repeat protein [Actinacidiphila sp. DG2A-62]|uniref:tetratricopeptide repeat protein n=1 Tax=Actinacidiphila sp. DG2A-62 TaxID=3108821 RepID=UPI002DBED149|nr:tetratricopeptide repeat protein [Actinacidiphila sp. DG2A-62]MEC3994466.1 tetratricopeptide repeat protein [Actinacidiphila sp. DG2A-62]
MLSPEEAAVLISAKARRKLPSESAVELANLCGRLPLALSIVGAILASDPDLSASELAGELTQEEQRLAGLEHEEVAVRAAFERSYVRLSEFHAAAFRSAALNPSADLSAESAALLLNTDHLKAKRALRYLLNCHLLERSEFPGRWRMHDLVRLYAAELSRIVDTKESRDAAQTRLVSRLEHRAACAAEWINSHPRDQLTDGFENRTGAMEWLTAEASNLVASVAVSAELGKYDTSADLAASVASYLNNVADFPSSLSVLFTAMEAAKKSNDLSRLCGVYNNLGIAYNSMRKYRHAVRWFNKSVALAHSLKDHDQEARALINLSGALRDLIGVEASMEPLTRAMRIRGDYGEEGGFALTNLGISLREAGRFQEAEGVLRRALTVHARNGAKKAEASTLAQLGTTLMQRAEQEHSTPHLREGARYLNAAIAAYREVRDSQGEAMCYLNLGNAAILASDVKKALESYQVSLQIFRGVGDDHGQGIVLTAIGSALISTGEVERGHSALREAKRFLEQFHEPDRKRLIDQYLHNSGT